jgi:hypothetical protein
MYPVKKAVEENWLYYAFAGFKKLDSLLKEEGAKVASLALIGTGNGVDAIGACHIFKDVVRIYLTDIDEETLPLALQNVKGNLDPAAKAAVDGFAGDVCEPLQERSIKVDLIYGNLPNIPLWDSEQTDGFGLSTFYSPRESAAPHPVIKQSMLELQLHFLRSAKACLTPGGSVVQLVGGRFPSRNFKLLYELAGFELTQLCAGLKPQTEASEVLTGYARAEKENDVEFTFYDYDKALAALKQDGQGNLVADEPMDYLEKTLKDCLMNATRALEAHRNGILIGHTCHVLRGTGK